MKERAEGRKDEFETETLLSFFSLPPSALLFEEVV
jgi:hypothetical protein